MKKKILIIVAFLILIHTSSVHAIPATVRLRSGGTNKYDIWLDTGGTKRRSIGYTTPYFDVAMNGKTYEGFCLDPGLSTPGGSVNCEPIQDYTRYGFNYIYTNAAAKNLKHEGWVLGFRFYSVYAGLSIENHISQKKLAIGRAISTFATEKALHGESDGYSNFIHSTTHEGSLQISYGISLAYEANNTAQWAKNNADAATSVSGGNIAFGSKSVAGTNVTYQISSSARLEASQLRFTCSNCTVNNSSLRWNGTSGSITVNVNNCNNEFTVSASVVGAAATSAGTTPYICQKPNSTSTQRFVIFDDGSAPGAVSKTDKIACDDPDCCTQNPITPGKITGDINNCCTDGSTSKASEYKLDELFCNPNNVDIYKSKCQNQYYQDETLRSNYCKLYCTERVEIEQPGAITATSGRYFTLTKTSAGTTSPHIMAYRRCRVTTDYKKWRNDYRAVLEQEKDAYNALQKALAEKKMVDEARRSSHQETCQYRCGEECDYDEETGRQHCSPKYCDGYYKYDEYSFNSVSYYTVKLNDDASTQYRTLQMINDGGGTVSQSTQRTTTMKHNCGPDYGYNWGADKQAKQNAVNSAQTRFNTATNTAKNLENELDKCQNYFTEYQGKNADNFKINTNMSFYYTQVYMDSTGELILDKQSINYKETPGCKIQPAGTNSKGETIYAKVGPEAGEDDLKDRRYSNTYKSGNQEMRDFKQIPVSLATNSSGFTRFLDTSAESYKANKAFSHDAKYTADCRWDEDDNQYYTLIPSGESAENTSTINYIRHGQEYRLHLTTLDGTYQTYWQLSGIGSPRPGESAGRFDEFITNEGKTCTGESADGESSLTCKLHVEYEVILTGKCNGINGTDTTNDPDSCEPYKEGYNLFTFKIADPANLFPNGTTDRKEGEYAYNWVSTTKGQTAMEDIQKKAARSETYSHDNLTYSYILTPTDMRNIKNYNKEKNADGGYSDFNMKCDCSGNACVKCKSNFLEELSKGNIIYDNQDHRAAGWTNSRKTIDAVRQSFGW